ncbi:MAG: Spermidine/putrescine transport system permease protein PotB [Chlamydiia bacterium]|nr:Spermidine/putrescine transport system permease protein PotB [Chlamydiia bacterium]MCH9615868.1 Spermidine/putrescine transport system permease protein PotB [Chlamydiia bacterium]MCH9628729.1 Spermidine/putrescine transport system permease protein PotB [Chlamydiia bacterium]
MKKHLPFFFGSTPFIWQALFFYLPLVILLASSFLNSGIHYIEIFTHLIYFKVILATLILSLTTAVICAVVAYPTAYFIAFHGKRLKYVFLFLLVVPFWTNFLLHVYAWFFILEENGFINQFLQFFHLGPFNMMNTLFAVVLMMVYTYIPFMVLPIFSALDRFDYRLIEASQDLGANFPQTFFKIIFPITLPALRTGFFLVMIPSFGEFIIPELLGGDRYYFVGNVVSLYVLGDGTEPLGAALTVVSSLILVAIVVPLYKWMKRYE